MQPIVCNSILHSVANSFCSGIVACCIHLTRTLFVRSQSRLQFGLSIRVVPNSYLWLLLVIPHGSGSSNLFIPKRFTGCQSSLIRSRSTRLLFKFSLPRFVVRPCYSTIPTTISNSRLIPHEPRAILLFIGTMSAFLVIPLVRRLFAANSLQPWNAGMLASWLFHLRLATRSNTDQPNCSLRLYCPLLAFPARCLPLFLPAVCPWWAVYRCGWWLSIAAAVGGVLVRLN